MGKNDFAVIRAILAGDNCLVLAPTAGGKTEAAFLPIASRMLSEGWKGLSVLYICPIKALLNNLDVRLQRYCTLLGRRSALWHGDVTTTARRHVLRDPPDCLLTTPESLEVMLVSPNVDARSLFANLRVVIVDFHREVASVREQDTGLAGEFSETLGVRCTLRDNRSGKDFFTDRTLTTQRDVFVDNGDPHSSLVGNQLQAEYNTVPLLAQAIADRIVHAILDVW